MTIIKFAKKKLNKGVTKMEDVKKKIEDKSRLTKKIFVKLNKCIAKIKLV